LLIFSAPKNKKKVGNLRAFKLANDAERLLMKSFFVQQGAAAVNMSFLIPPANNREAEPPGGVLAKPRMIGQSKQNIFSGLL